MARIRSFKPEAAQHRKVGRLSIPARWLWFVLVTQADDEGRLVADGGQLKLAAFGYDRITPSRVVELLEEIAATGLIRLYELGAVPYLDFPSWKDHQRIDRPTPSKLPPYSDSTSPRRVLDESSTSPRRGSDGSEGSEGSEGNGKNGGSTPDPAAALVMAPPTFAAFWDAYPVKEGKGKALEQWRRLNIDGPIFDAILAGLDRWRMSDRWARGYVVHPATWLHQRRWEDHPAPATAATSARTRENAAAAQRFLLRHGLEA